MRPQLQGLREDLRRAAFWTSVDEPDAEELISGKLLRYSPSSGSVRLRYTRDDLVDFEQNGPDYSHPMHFSAKWSMEIEGTPEEVSGLSFFVEGGPNNRYMFRFGKRVIEVDMPEEDFGSLVLVASGVEGAMRPFGELTIDGEIDAGWIGGLMDAWSPLSAGLTPATQGERARARAPTKPTHPSVDASGIPPLPCLRITGSMQAAEHDDLIPVDEVEDPVGKPP